MTPVDTSREGPNLRMKSLRASLGLTQVELAARVGVSRQTISMIEALSLIHI